MHWRGDRNGADPAERRAVPRSATARRWSRRSRTPASSTRSNAFKSFNVAFPGLDRARRRAERRATWTAFTDVHPAGHAIRRTRSATSTTRSPPSSRPAATSTSTARCRRLASCRRTASTTATAATRSIANGNAGATAHPGFFGTDGKLSFEIETQIFKVPHLRNMYTKVGMFGQLAGFEQPAPRSLPPQRRGDRPGARLRLPARRRARHARALLHRSGVLARRLADVILARRDERRGEPVRHPVRRPDEPFARAGRVRRGRRLRAASRRSSPS